MRPIARIKLRALFVAGDALGRSDVPADWRRRDSPMMIFAYRAMAPLGGRELCFHQTFCKPWMRWLCPLLRKKTDIAQIKTFALQRCVFSIDLLQANITPFRNIETDHTSQSRLIS
jgi:hypothetical protein